MDLDIVFETGKMFYAFFFYIARFHLLRVKLLHQQFACHFQSKVAIVVDKVIETIQSVPIKSES